MAKHYFTQLTEACNELDRKAQAYLDTLPFMPNDKVVRRLYQIAFKTWEDCGRDWDAIPEWVASAIDGYLPYSAPPRNGSLFHHMGYSVVSQDAHLRNLLEIAEGRTNEELDFPVLVDKDFYKEEVGV